MEGVKGPLYDLPFWWGLTYGAAAIAIALLSIRYRRLLIFSILFSLGLGLGSWYALYDSLSPHGREDWRILMLTLPAGLAFIAGLVFEGLASLFAFVERRHLRR